MVKYYVLLILAFVGALVFIFTNDPCAGQLRTDFAVKHPGSEILDSSAGVSSAASVQCHIQYRTSASNQIVEEIWLYQDAGKGWSFSRNVETENDSD